ncbi:MAG: ribulose-phosphate 3-epimerase [Pirellulales bacterium]
MGLPASRFRHVRAPAVAPELVTELLASGPAVLPSLLLCDFGHLHDEVERLQAAGARALHLDVMDGRFVPQLTYGPVVVEAVCRSSRVPVEAHLMIEDPLATLDAYLDAGVDIVTLHFEALSDPLEALSRLRHAGVLGQLAISPKTPVAAIEPLLTGADRELCDGVLVMSVEPGFGGQAFLPSALEKLSTLAMLRHGRTRPLRLAVDGGISLSTIGSASAAGAELIVAGSAVLRSDNYARALAELEQTAREAA